VTNLNNALKDHTALQSKSAEDLIKDLGAVPDAIRGAVRNNGGGHYNHALFWEIMKPGGANAPAGALGQAIQVIATAPDGSDRVDTAALLAQCGIQGRRRFPYALTRADELAYVSSVEKSQLDELIRVELLKNQTQLTASNKLQTKGLTRAHRTQHRLRT